MTEAEWRECASTTKLLACLVQSKQSRRKLRLFAVACCRRNWDLLVDLSRRAVEAHELYAEGLIKRAALASAIAEARSFTGSDAFRSLSRVERYASMSVAFPIDFQTRMVANSMEDVAAWRRPYPMTYDGSMWIMETPEAKAEYSTARRAEGRAQADLIREIFCNPMRLSTIDPAWLSWNGGTIPGLAEAIYQEKAFDRLPILADVLEGAGCADTDLLSHCRAESGHVRGCWALDALLGRR